MHGTAAIWFFAGTLLPAALLSWAAGFLVRRWAARWGLVDQPGFRKVHGTPTPMGGGLSIWFAVLTPFAAGTAVLIVGWGRMHAAALDWPVAALVAKHATGLVQRLPDLWILLGAATVLMILGLIDDIRGLDWRWRLSVQTAVAAGVILWRGWQATAFVEFPLLMVALSVVWIVGLVNAFNMLDNMDGLSAGVAAIVAAMLTAIVLFAPGLEPAGPQLFVGGFLLVLLGALLGFLWHNRPPAHMFMGDAGSYFVGFCIAAATLLATFANYESHARHTILAPLFVLAVPLYDLVTVLLIRIREGRNPFVGDTSHFSHRLVDLGFSKGQAVLTVYLMTAACGLAGLLLPRLDTVGAAIDFVLVGCVIAVIAVIELTARNRIRSNGRRNGRRPRKHD
jgi:UDP-GlcNAc:undecaprenyl-phosphate GlcNAc-1-phosphate transferase